MGDRADRADPVTEVTLHAPFAGWLSALDDVPDPVFAERMMGEGLAIDPLEGVLRAPAEAQVVAVPASAHAVSLRLANGAELLLHIGLDTVALAGRGFEALVKAGDRVSQGQPLIAFELDAVARAARDMITPIVVASEGARLAVERTGRQVAAGDLIARVTAASTAQAEVTAGSAVTRSILVAAPHGLHARPAARIVALLKPFAAEVTLMLGERRAGARSTVALLALGVTHGATLEASATGPDAAAALEALAGFAAARFGDGDAPLATLERRSGPVCAAPGLAIGRIRQLRLATIEVGEAGQGIEVESAALATARAMVAGRLGSDDLADAHRAILDDPELIGDARARIIAGKSAGHAWRQATAAAAGSLLATGDLRLAERVADLHDIERQLLAALTGEPPALPTLEPDTILVAEDLLPSQFLALDRTRLAGICTAAGGPTAHVAILAAAAGVPMVVAAGPEVLALADDAPAILDADAATLTVDPDVDALAAASATLADRREAREAAIAAAHAPCHTADGVRIEVFANLGAPDDAAAAVRAGAEGCGLLRTEFLFLDRAEAPGEADQRAIYAGIAAALGDRPLIVRTLDIGGDKPVPYLPQAREDNPALGCRGVRLSLARPDLLAVQLRAILVGVPGAQCRIMLPMVVDVAEVARVRTLLDEAARAVGRTDPVELGVMVETPAAAVLAAQLAEVVDFLSIGTNDLTQYTLAADRGNAAVAAMLDPLHPAVLRLIAHTVEGARRHGRWVGVCGGLASDPRAAPLLVGLGITELSAVPAAVPAVKAAVRARTLVACEALAIRALAATSPAAVRALLEGTA
jgi:multiphosphoryl transfer protein